MEIKKMENDPWLLTRDAFEIYGPCMYKASFREYSDEMDEFCKNSDCRIFACTESNQFIGIIVLKLIAKDFAEIIGISVKKECRQNGIGKFMMLSAAGNLHLKMLAAETDGEAVGFYEHTGFSVKPFIRHFSDGDAVRYRCNLLV